MSLRGEEISKTGVTIGIDQLISTQPRLVPQEKGILTQARVWAATIFVDYVTGYFRVGFMTDQSGDSTLQANRDFEHLEATRDINIKEYHTDNVVLQNAHSQMMSNSVSNVSDSVE